MQNGHKQTVHRTEWTYTRFPQTTQNILTTDTFHCLKQIFAYIQFDKKYPSDFLSFKKICEKIERLEKVNHIDSAERSQMDLTSHWRRDPYTLAFSFSLIIAVKSSWLNPLSISALDIVLFMLFNLLLVSITILLCFFFLFRVVFQIFFVTLIVIKLQN